MKWFGVVLAIVVAFPAVALAGEDKNANQDWVNVIECISVEVLGKSKHYSWSDNHMLRPNPDYTENKIKFDVYRTNVTVSVPSQSCTMYESWVDDRVLYNYKDDMLKAVGEK